MPRIVEIDNEVVDTRQLEYFVAVADESSFTRAAIRLYAAQSTVSAGVRALERYLGAALFDRSTARVMLTAAGAALLPEARRTIEYVDRVRNAVALNPAQVRGRLSIGTFIALDAVELPALLGEFHRRHPLVDLQLIASVSGSTGLAEEVRQGRLDVAFSGLPSGDGSGFKVLELARSRFVALLPEGHALAVKDQVEPLDLAGERWIDAPAGYASRIVLERVLDAARITRVVTAEVADAGEIPKLVEAGLGVAAIPEIILRPTAGVIAVPISAVGLEFAVSVISRAGSSAAATAFLELLAERVAPGRSRRLA